MSFNQIWKQIFYHQNNLYIFQTIYAALDILGFDLQMDQFVQRRTRAFGTYTIIDWQSEFEFVR